MALHSSSLDGRKYPDGAHARPSLEEMMQSSWKFQGSAVINGVNSLCEVALAGSPENNGCPLLGLVGQYINRLSGGFAGYGNDPRIKIFFLQKILEECPQLVKYLKQFYFGPEDCYLDRLRDFLKAIGFEEISLEIFLIHFVVAFQSSGCGNPGKWADEHRAVFDALYSDN
ncbi:MAG: hypothetical protein WC846_01035 [Candidatus Gracilibacteria bacterium]|jgi:hypothetical protein